MFYKYVFRLSTWKTSISFFSCFLKLIKTADLTWDPKGPDPHHDPHHQSSAGHQWTSFSSHTDLVDPGAVAVLVCESFRTSLQQNIVWEPFRNVWWGSFEEQQWGQERPVRQSREDDGKHGFVFRRARQLEGRRVLVRELLQVDEDGELVHGGHEVRSFTVDLNTKTQSLIHQSDLLETITVIRFELKAFMLYETLLLVTAAQIKSQLNLYFY